MKKIILILLILLLLVVLLHPFLVGRYLEPRLESTLTLLFGMPVEIWDLRVNVIKGKVRTSRIRFLNQPEFQDGAHLDNQGLEFEIDLFRLLDKEVKIGEIRFEEPYYYIDRIQTSEGKSLNNISAWVQHIKSRKKKGNKDEKKPLGKKWRVGIKKISIKKGTFIFADRSKTPERKYIFRELDGYLENFTWPNPDPLNFNQKVRMTGAFGETKPAPFWIEGIANFSLRDVGFDLKGEVNQGDITGQRMFWENLPFEIQSGIFNLKLNVKCEKRQLRSFNLLVLESLKATPESAQDALLWGLPLMTSVGFLENQKKIYLTVPVRGDITDPKFDFTTAFRRAFQESLGRKTSDGFNALKNGSARIATQTTGLVTEAPGKIVQGIGKISTIVADKVAPKPSSVPNETAKSAVIASPEGAKQSQDQIASSSRQSGTPRNDGQKIL